MQYFKIVVAIAASIGALDYLFGNRLKLGGEFERAFRLWGAIALSMIGMLVMAPWLGQLMTPLFNLISEYTPIDPSVVPAMFLANDMGASALCTQVAEDTAIGNFNGYVVSSMMGCTISFTLPISLGMVKKEQMGDLCRGILAGVATIPVGCLVSGIAMGLPLLTVLIDILPLIVLAGLIVLGLLKAPDLCVKIFKIVGFIVKALIVAGLIIGIFSVLPGIALLEPLGSFGEAATICVNTVVILSGMLPLFMILSRMLKKPLGILEKKCQINGASTMGLLGNLVTNVTTYGMMGEMDPKGTVLCGAFSVSAAFVFGSHLAYTIANCPDIVPYVLIGKLTAGATALVLAVFINKNESKRTVPNDSPMTLNKNESKRTVPNDSWTVRNLKPE